MAEAANQKGAQTYKCPNCDGGLIFNPENQKFCCEYCMSEFTERELANLSPAGQSARSAFAEEGPAAGGASAGEVNADVYTCPSCGAEIMTDANTAATYCYYCHNPVTLSGRLSGNFRPDAVIPFALTKEQAVQEFLGWVHKKKFCPRAFFSKKQIEKITGVYFPYWTTDMQMNGRLDGQGTIVKSWESGDTRYTKTDYYHVVREGQMEFDDFISGALQKTMREISEGVQPYDLTQARPFTAGYLAGFQAQKRDIEQAMLQQSVYGQLENYGRMLVKSGTERYASLSTQRLEAIPTAERWRYVLLPVWVLTYKVDGNKPYYYAMNGQTGKVCGKLPVDWKRLALLFGGIFVPLSAILTIAGYFL